MILVTYKYRYFKTHLPLHILICAKNGRSHLLAPKSNFLLLEIPPLFLVNQYEVQEVSALEAVVDVFERRCQISASQVEPDRNALAFDRCSIHDFELVQVLSFGHSGLT